MDSASLPVIPAEEYRSRWERVLSLMARLGLNLLIAYADDHATFGAAHARWLANIPVYFEPVIIVFQMQGEPILLTGPESDGYARLIGHIADVRALRELAHPDEEYPYSRLQSLANILNELTSSGRTGGKVGLAGGALMGAKTMAALNQAMPQAQWIDVENEMCMLRAVKSPAEIAVIRYAYKLADTGIQAAVDAIRPGISEREIAAVAESAMRLAGAEGSGIDTIVACGENTRPILARSTFQTITDNDLVLLTVTPRYEGYHAAIGRLVLVGEPGEEINDALQTAIKAQQTCYHAIRPGIEGHIVEKAGREVVKSDGLGEYFAYSGLHSVGVCEFEPPIFGPSSKARLEKDMIISVDIPIFNTPWGGLRIEDGYLITGEWAERLNETPFLIQKETAVIEKNPSKRKKKHKHKG
jgi:Xaa-Pro aminopeptidase